MELKNVRRIGVFKLRNIGDVLMITPLLRALRETFPGARITAVVNSGTEAMLANNPHIDEVILFHREGKNALRREFNFLRDVRRARFDLVIAGTEGERTAWSALLSGARYRLGIVSYRWGRFNPLRRVYNLPVRTYPPASHEVERHFAIVKTGGLRLNSTVPGSLVLEVPGDLRAWAEEQLAPLRPARVVQVHPVSRWLWKCWTSESMAAVIDWLQEERGTRVFVTTGPIQRERQRARDIVSLCRTAPLFFDGNLSLAQLGALSAVSDGYFGVDTAPMHVAASVGVPVVALFGPTGPEGWRPWTSRGRVLVAPCACNLGGRRVCDWSEGAVRACLASITVGQVQAALDEFLPATA